MKKVLIFVLLSLLVLSGALVSAQEAELDYAKPEILVDTAWVLEHLEDENVRLIHLASNLEDYEAAHIDGALFATIANLNNPDDPISGQIGTPEQVSTGLGSLGVTVENTVVLYDANNNLFAARAYWVLKYYQHADVRIYNGGTKRWEEDGQALVTGTAPEVEPVVYEIAEADPEIRTTSEYVLEHLDDAGVQMCDARNPEEYIGTDVRADRGGHIPGAINLDWVHTVNQDGTFKSFAELDTLFQAAGFDRTKQIITYCQTGVRGAHVWFALRELLGYEDVRNYDGSWVEWGNSAELPIDN
ncbi:MAG: sulfurtransferase [Anaerolineae bacterium]|nr:sulfurtransferase [Anaerolineae bacterium]NUQ03186.1 sulfurtransferase [Anaerolineae bacterium]